MKPTFVVLCAAVLAGCASSSAPVWQKPGASQTEVDEALRACRVQARLNPQLNVGGVEDRDRAELGAIDRCMRAKGYAAGTR